MSMWDQNKVLVSSIFSNERIVDDDTRNLFCNKKAEKLKRMHEDQLTHNKRLWVEVKNGTDPISSSARSFPSCQPAEIIQYRKQRNQSSKSVSILHRITVPTPLLVPSLNNTDEQDVTDIQGGVIRLFVRHAESIIRNSGVLIIKSEGSSVLIPPTLFQCISSRAKFIENEVSRRLDEVNSCKWISSNQEVSASMGRGDDDKVIFRYKEVSSRCLGRLDIRYQMDQPPFTDPQIIANPTLMPLLKSLLGDQVKLLYSGLIVSFPGSVDQPWHQDGAMLFDEDEILDRDGNAIDLPPYALNVFSHWMKLRRI